MVSTTESVQGPSTSVSPGIRSRLRSRAWWITGGYALFAGAWIFLSDSALAALISDPARLVQISLYKGFAFVTATSLLLFVLIRTSFRSISDGYDLLRAEKLEKQAHATEVERLSRLYAALSQINQTIVRTTEPERLFEQVSRILVEFGGFRMVWIGKHDPATGRIFPTARRGDDAGHLSASEIYADDRPGGRGPSGIAFRSGTPYICNDIFADPATAHWRDAALKAGYQASAAFPIREGDRVMGILNVYADEKGFFRDREVALLEEAVADIAHALENRAREEARREAQARAEAERAFSDTLIDSLPGILYLYDNEGRFQRWNRNFEAVSGYSHNEIAAMHPLDFFADEDRKLLSERISRVFEVGEASVEAPFRTKGGDQIPYLFTGRKVVFQERDCLVGVGVDISARARAEGEKRAIEERFRTTLDNIHEGCQIIGSDWRYLYLNNAASIHNRRPNEELLGRTMMECWPGIENSSAFPHLRQCMEERVPTKEEVEFVFPDGSSGWFDVRAEPVPEGIFILSMDITERRNADEALRHLNQTLEERVAKRTEELEDALVQAEVADRLKSAFLATMSHELRTPLNSIIGFTGIVLQELAGPLNEEQRKQLGMVRGSARHLLDLINDVLDLSKIEAGQLEIRVEPFDLRESVERVVAGIQPLADQRGIELHIACDGDIGTIVNDRRRVEQILINLVNNGIKFTDRGSVRVTVAPEGDNVALRVRDTGVGIREEDLIQLFQPFRQVDMGLTRLHEGTGLGLAICRRLAALMGGEISVTSTWGEGSEFTVTLPSEWGGPPG